MNNWKEFVFNEPYVGGKIERINNVILPKQYVGFMKKHNGGKGDIGETWLELYPLEELQEINDDYCIEDFLPNHNRNIEIIPTIINSVQFSISV